MYIYKQKLGQSQIVQYKKEMSVKSLGWVWVQVDPGRLFYLGAKVKTHTQKS